MASTSSCLSHAANELLCEVLNSLSRLIFNYPERILLIDRTAKPQQGVVQQGVVLRFLASFTATALKFKPSEAIVPRVLDMMLQVCRSSGPLTDDGSLLRLSPVRQLLSALLLPRLGAAAADGGLDGRSLGTSLKLSAGCFAPDDSSCSVWQALGLFSSLPARRLLDAAAAMDSLEDVVVIDVLIFFRTCSMTIHRCSMVLIEDVERGPAASSSLSQAEKLCTLCNSLLRLVDHPVIARLAMVSVPNFFIAFFNNTISFPFL